MVFIQNIDDSILMFIQNNIRCEFLDTIMPIVTSLGNGGAIWIVIMIIMLISKKYHKYGVILGITLLCSYILGEQIIKNIIARARPCNINPSIQMLISIPKSYSFPSGHSSNSFAAAIILYKANKSWGKAAVVLATLIAFSRMYLYVHYPSDVLCGSIMGIIVALIIYEAFQRKHYVSEKHYDRKN